MTRKTALRQKSASAPTYGFKDLSGVDGAPEGTFEAYVSVFENVDLVGDRVKTGAFANDLAAWAASGDPVPVIWSHQWQDPDFHIGKTVELEEVAAGDDRLPEAIKDLGGLRTVNQLDLDERVAAQVWKLLQQRRVKEFSFAYDVLDEAKAKDGANDLLELRLIEVGPTLKGANPATQLVDVKASPDVKAAQVKALVQLDGSREQEAEQVKDAALAAINEQLPHRDVYAAGIEATFDDRIVVYVEDWDQPYGKGDYFEASWSRGDDGAIVVGELAPVAFTATTVPKSAGSRSTKTLRQAEKAGARNSSADAGRLQSIHDLVRELGAACELADAEADGESSDTSGEPKASGRAEVKSTLDALTRLQLDVLAAGIPTV